VLEVRLGLASIGSAAKKLDLSIQKEEVKNGQRH